MDEPMPTLPYPDGLPPMDGDLWNRGCSLALEYVGWLHGGNTTGNLSRHAVSGLAHHFAQALAAAEAKGRADEREACADTVEHTVIANDPDDRAGWALRKAATAIRSRKD